MRFTLLDDEEFLNFNVSAFLDPALKAKDGPDQTTLYQLAILGRQGDRFAIGEFTETIDRTLQPAAFASFERLRGVRAIGFPDWFYSKLYQFFEILLHESVAVLGNGPGGDWGAPKTARPWEEGERRLRGSGSSLEPDEIEAAFSPEAREETYPWYEIVALCASPAPGRPRVEQLRDRIKGLGRVQHARGWSKNERRDRLILAGLEKNLPYDEICQELDRHLIATTEGMQIVGAARWVVAWEDPQLHRDVQKLFSKVRRRKSVKQ